MTSNEAVVSDYTRYARALRQALLNQCEGSAERAKSSLKQVFNALDDNGDGVLTASELRGYLSGVVAGADGDAVGVDGDVERFTDMLLRQIDINHDNNISYAELSEFLWPPVDSEREVGVVIAVFHQAFVTSLFSRKADRDKALSPSMDNDDALELMKAFAAKADVKLLRGNLVETKKLKQAFSKLMCVSLGLLSHHEVDLLLQSLDTNNDGVVSAREFKQWLMLPAEIDVETFASAKAEEEAEKLRVQMEADKADKHKAFEEAAEHERARLEREAEEAAAAAVAAAEKLRLEAEQEALAQREAERVKQLQEAEEAEKLRQQLLAAEEVAALEAKELQRKADEEAAEHERARLEREAEEAAVAAVAAAEKLRLEAEQEALAQREAERVKQLQEAEEAEKLAAAGAKELQRKADEEGNKSKEVKAENNDNKGVNWRGFSEFTRAVRKSFLLRNCGDSAALHSAENLDRVFNAVSFGSGPNDVKHSGSSEGADSADAVSTEQLKRQLILISTTELLSVAKLHDLSGCTLEEFVDLLLQQIDIDHTGSVNHSKMANFLWPLYESEREIGAVLQIVRGTMLQSIGDKGWRGDEHVLMQLFAKKNNIKLMQGDLMDVRALRSALNNTRTEELQALSTYEVDSIIGAMDVNGDGVVSPGEFKRWLLFVSPSAVSTGSAAGNAAAAAAVITAATKK